MRRVALMTGLAVILAGNECDPKPPTAELTVEPLVVCPGGTVTVSWKLHHGMARLLYDSSSTDLAAVLEGDFSTLELGSDEGSKQVVITKNTTFKAASVQTETTFAESAAIQVSLAEAGVETATFPACVGSSTWGGWSSSLEVIAPGLVAGEVVNETPPFLPGAPVGPAITLTHAGTSLEVPGSSAQVFPAGTPWAGAWGATAELPAGFGCPSADGVMGSGPPLIKPPPLKARIAYQCP